MTGMFLYVLLLCEERKNVCQSKIKTIKPICEILDIGGISSQNSTATKKTPAKIECLEGFLSGFGGVGLAGSAKNPSRGTMTYPG